MPSKEIQYIIEDDERIDTLLSKKFKGHSRTYFQSLLEKGLIISNGLTVKKRERLKIGTVITINFLEKPSQDYAPQNIPLEILYQDEHLIIINKQQGIVVHPAPGHPSNTLINALLFEYQELTSKESIRFGIVHRLDKDTSGVMVIAKNEKVHAALSKLFQSREIKKEYLALCIGHPGNKILHNFLRRDPSDRKKYTVSDVGKEAISEIETLKFHKGYSLVKITPKTGRTHQIRVHLKSLGTPVIGDPIYGSSKNTKELKISSGQFLHAHKLEFIHPMTGENLTFEAPIPERFEQLKKTLF